MRSRIVDRMDHHAEERPVVPGELNELSIELWPTCNTFRQGHRIRLEIAGSDTAFSSIHGIVHQTQPVQLPDATHTIHHARSRLVLPTIPA